MDAVRERQLGYECHEQGKYDEAFDHLTNAAEMGDAIAMMWLSDYYFYGYGGYKPENDKGEYWLRKSADEGHNEAMHNFAYRCEFGISIPQNERLAAEYYKKAGDAGIPVSYNNLANLYKDGRGVEKDIRTAFKLYKLAAEQGCELGAYNLANEYYKGEDVPQDEGKFFEYADMAIQLGSTEIYTLLANAYTEDSLMFEEDYEQVYRYTQMGADKKNPTCLNNLGYLYENGLYVTQNDRLAFNNYYESAQLGSPDGEFNTGRCFFFGIGIDINDDEAEKWMEKAEEDGYEGAIDFLEKAKEELGIN